MGLSLPTQKIPPTPIYEASVVCVIVSSLARVVAAPVSVHHDQIFGGTAVPRIEEFVGIGINAGFVDRSTRRSAASVGVPQCTVDTYERLCALAGSRPAAGGRAGLAR
jgi:hypothetical protein